MRRQLVVDAVLFDTAQTQIPWPDMIPAGCRRHGLYCRGYWPRSRPGSTISPSPTKARPTVPPQLPVPMAHASCAPRSGAKLSPATPLFSQRKRAQDRQPRTAKRFAPTDQVVAVERKPVSRSAVFTSRDHPERARLRGLVGASVAILYA